MQYSVPQFVDVEDKVIGPLSIKQFLWILGGAGISVVLWLILPVVLAVLLDIPVLLLAGAFAFFKVNGVTFPMYVANLFGFVIKPKTRVWKREVELDKTIVKAVDKNEKPKLEKIKLRDVNIKQLAYILDHELAAQAQTHTVTNPIEMTQKPQAQVIMNQNVEVQNQNLLTQQAYQAPQEQPALAQAPAPEQTPDLLQNSEPALDLPEVEQPKNSPIITSIKPFRMPK